MVIQIYRIAFSENRDMKSTAVAETTRSAVFFRLDRCTNFDIHLSYLPELSGLMIGTVRQLG